MKIKIALSLLFASLFASFAFAAPDVKPVVPPKPAADPAVAACRAKNQATHKAVLDLYMKAKSGGKIDPKEAQAFATMEGRLNAHAQALARDGFTLADCATMAKDLESEKANVTRMAATPATAPAAPAKPAGTK